MLTGIRQPSEDAVQGKVHSPTYRMAMEEDCCAVVHPAKLTRGLADIVVAKGVSLFERVGTAAMTDEGSRVRVDTSDGPVYGGQGIIATNAWAAHDPALSRRVLPPHVLLHHRHRAVERGGVGAGGLVRVAGDRGQAGEPPLLPANPRLVGIMFGVPGPHRHLPIPDRAALRPQRAHLRAAPGELRPHLPAARRGPLHACLGWAGGHDHRLPAAVRQPLARGSTTASATAATGSRPPTSAARSWSTS